MPTDNLCVQLTALPSLKPLKPPAVQDCDDTLHKLGTVERPQQQPSEDTAAGAASGDAAPGASHVAAERRGKRGGAKVIAAAAPDPLGFGDGEWPDSDEEIFWTPSAAANAAMTATPGTNQSLLLGSLSMRPGESVLGLRTPAANRRLLADAETPLVAAARSLSMAASLPRPIDLEEMFEPVPEHFEFDLEEFEVRAAAADKQLSIAYLYRTLCPCTALGRSACWLPHRP